MANIYVVNEKTRAMFLQFNDAEGVIHYMVNDEIVTKDEGNRRFEEMKAANGFAYHPLNTQEDLMKLSYDLSGEYQSLAIMLQRGAIAAADVSASEEALKLCAAMLNILNQTLDCKMVIDNHPVNIVLDKPITKWAGFEVSPVDDADTDSATGHQLVQKFMDDMNNAGDRKALLAVYRNIIDKFDGFHFNFNQMETLTQLFTYRMSTLS